MKIRHVIALILALILTGLYVSFITWAVYMGCSFANAQTCHVRLHHYFDSETTWLTLGVGLVDIAAVAWAWRATKRNDQDL